MLTKPVPPKSLTEALEHVRSGGVLVVPTYARCLYIDGKCLAKWERVGHQLLTEEGDGYRLRQGRSSVYLLPGQLKFAD